MPSRLKFSGSLVAVIALVAVVAGVVAGRATAGSAATGGGGGAGGAMAGKRVDVIVKATNSQFWQTTFAGAQGAAKDTGAQVSLFGPTAETDVAGQVQLMENSISRGVQAIVVAPNSNDALNNVIDRARHAGIKVITIDSRVTTKVDGFIGTDNNKAGQRGGQRLCELVKAKGPAVGNVLLESAMAGVETLSTRDDGFKAGLAANCPQLTVSLTRYNNNDINTAASQVNDAITADSKLVAVFADNNSSGDGAARAIKDNNAADRIPVVAYDADPQEIAGLKDGSLDTLIVQNPFFFGHQGVVEAASAAAGTLQPDVLDPGAVLVDQTNMAEPPVQQLLNPPTAQASG
jgi:ribose transport system substrate-binding protein